MIKSIYLDLDETLVATTDAVLEHHNLPNPYLDKANWGRRDLNTLVGRTQEELWHTLDADFWANIPKLPWADILINTAKDIVGEKNVFILTAPIRSVGCCYGKQLWVKKNYPDMTRRTIMTSAKHACVPHDGLLIDDSEQNGRELEEDGKLNNFYLFPDYNNSKAELLQPILDNPKLVDPMIRTFINGLH